MLTGTKSALPQTRQTFLVPARDRRDGGAGGLPAMLDQIQYNSEKKQTAKLYNYVWGFQVFFLNKQQYSRKYAKQIGFGSTREASE